MHFLASVQEYQAVQVFRLCVTVVNEGCSVHVLHDWTDAASLHLDLCRQVNAHIIL